MIFSPDTAVADDLLPVEEPETETEPEVTEDPKPEDKPAPALGADAKALIDAINAQRDEREARAKAEADNVGFRARAEAAEAKIVAQEKSSKNRMLDPAGWLKRTGMSDKDLALTAEAIMFTLMPEKADPAFRIKLMEAKALRDEEAAEAEKLEAPKRESARQEEARKVAEADITKRYTAAMKAGVTTFKPGTYPASQAWYGQDHDSYAGELFSTARAMAEAAERAGTGRPDLSADGVAKALEAKLAARFAKFQGTASKPAVAKSQVKTMAQVESEVQEAEDEGMKVIVTSPELKTKPGKPLTEREIIARATKAAFGRT